MRDMYMVDAHEILIEVLFSYSDADKWVGSQFEKIKRMSNAHVGSIGQNFVEKLCFHIGFDCEFPRTKDGRRTRTSPWDIKIEGVAFEIKTATEDVHRNFQFNHVRYHRDYGALLCVGVAPDSILFDAWPKADVAAGKAGHLVGMDKGTSATQKLTKRNGMLRSIAEYEEHILALVASMEDSL